MALHSYGVLKGKAIEVRLGAGQSPHYQVRLVDDTTDYRIAINVKSSLAPSELEFVVLEHYQHPITGLVEGLGLGFTRLQSSPGTGALDFIRGNLFDRAADAPAAVQRARLRQRPEREDRSRDAARGGRRDARWSTPSASAGGRSRARRTSTSASSLETASTTST